jgi:hypothetical protein
MVKRKCQYVIHEYRATDKSSTERFIAVFTKAYHFIRIYRDLFLILLHPLRLGLPSNVFTWDIRTKTVQTSLDSHM